MSRFLEVVVAAATLLAIPAAAHAQDATAGEKVFAKCKACHMVGDSARNRIGPHLNELFGRTAGTIEGFNYSKAMKEAGASGLVWDEETLGHFLANPRASVKGTRMAFPGLKDEGDVSDLTAYLKRFSKQADTAPAEEASAPVVEPEARAEGKAPTPEEKTAIVRPIPTHGVLHLGRPATEQEITAWDIDVRPDGLGLPEGSGTVMEGEPLYTERCASCHGDFGEAIGRWPVLAGGFDTLTRERPVKTIGSYWPYLSTVYDYIRRAMPFGDARSLTDDEVYALTAYVLYLNDVVTDQEFELSKENFTSIELPNEDGFVVDDRLSEPHYAEAADPCMRNCKPGKAKITMHAAVLDVTPEDGNEDEASGGSID
ncbi:c-type cytochrome [Mesorhizobium xinjiangense]|uniref:c-type cytochrome n=1 Tax=Mesorhizobium xinjiangense TaxID=2678685 RepID=UPI0012EDF2A7|nr:c-type cytochrome [Mesorhizobium xinjiangense]